MSTILASEGAFWNAFIAFCSYHVYRIFTFKLFNRFEIDEAVHVDTQESYKYKIGVCTSIENASPPDCAVLQTRLDDTHAICVGQQQKAQVSRSRLNFLIQLGVECV